MSTTVENLNLILGDTEDVLMKCFGTKVIEKVYFMKITLVSERKVE